MRATLSIFALLLCTAMMLPSCASNSTSGNPNTAAVRPTPLKAGSTCWYRVISVDSIGTVLSDSSSGPGLHDSAIASGISMAGKTNVTQYYPSLWFRAMSYDSNGDISYYNPPQPGEQATWTTIPLASKGRVASIYPDGKYCTWFAYTGSAQRKVGGVVYNAESFDKYEGQAALGPQDATRETQWFDIATGVLIEVDFQPERGAHGEFLYQWKDEIRSFNSVK